MPPGKYQVIYADLTNQKSEDYLSQIPVGEIAESSSVLFLWVTTSGLDRGLKVIERWGFEYKTCMVWNKEFLHAVNDNVEILLIGVKGSPAMIFKEHEPYRIGNKPEVIRERIRATYLGAKLELLPDGWQVWEPRKAKSI